MDKLNALLQKLDVNLVVDEYEKCRRDHESGDVYLGSLEIQAFAKKAGVGFCETYQFILAHELGHALLYSKGGDHKSEPLAWQAGEQVYKYLFGEDPPLEYEMVRETCLSYH